MNSDDLFGLRFQAKFKVARVSMKVDERNGELTAGVQGEWFGDNQYFKLDAPTIAEQINDGDVVEGFATVRKFRDNMFPGYLIVTHINGKAVAKS